MRSTCTGSTAWAEGAACGAEPTTATLVAKPASRASENSAAVTSAVRTSSVVASGKCPLATIVTTASPCGTLRANRPAGSVNTRADPDATSAPAMGAWESASVTTPAIVRSIGGSGACARLTPVENGLTSRISAASRRKPRRIIPATPGAGAGTPEYDAQRRDEVLASSLLQVAGLLYSQECLPWMCAPL